MVSNFEIFLNFLADNFALEKYIIAYTKRYNITYNPFHINVKRKAEKNPKGLFIDILGSGHSFKKLEQKWLEYIEDTINYVPQPNDYVYCSYYAYNVLSHSYRLLHFHQAVALTAHFYAAVFEIGVAYAVNLLFDGIVIITITYWG